MICVLTIKINQMKQYIINNWTPIFYDGFEICPTLKGTEFLRETRNTPHITMNILKNKDFYMLGYESHKQN